MSRVATERFLLPDLGEGLTEATIVTWLVQPGDTVVVDQPVVEVESAKSSVELPSPFAGRVEELCAAVGDIVRKDAPLITVAVDAVAPAASADIVPGTALRAD
ncbi:MAG TPA: biotin/lipoyl-containing protein, partial [Humibacter sp.]|nr:biotin/lipoyl-containing protein [Humibacter sp.]